MNFYIFVNVLLLIVLADNISCQEAEAMKPIRCRAVLCPQVMCAVGQKQVTPPNECCPVCPVDCTTVLCALPKCQTLVTPPNECCPVCQNPQPVDCSNILCLYPECENGQEPVTPPNQCCPVCPAK